MFSSLARTSHLSLPPNNIDNNVTIISRVTAARSRTCVRCAGRRSLSPTVASCTWGRCTWSSRRRTCRGRGSRGGPGRPRSTHRPRTFSTETPETYSERHLLHRVSAKITPDILRSPLLYSVSLKITWGLFRASLTILYLRRDHLRYTETTTHSSESQ